MHTLPLHVDDDPHDTRARQSFAEVTADGIALRMLLDTGAYRTTVPHRIDAQPVTTDAPEHRPLIRLRSVHWGSLTIKDLVVSMEPPGWRHPPLLGIDVLSRHTCHFKFGSDTLELDGSPPECETWPLPTPPGKTPRIPLAWRGITTEGIWDTGSGITIVNRTWADRHPHLVTISDEYGTGTDAAGRTGRNPKGILAPFTIGALEFPEQPCGVVPLDGALQNVSIMFGLPAISHADWYFDFQRQRWTVRREHSN